VSECEISPGHWLEALNIGGYDTEVAQTIQSRGKGRLLAYVKSNAGYKRLTQVEDPNCDMIVMKGRGLVMVGIYAGFKTIGCETVNSNFNTLLRGLKQVCDRSESIIIGGDFNVDPSKHDNAKSKSLELWTLESGLEQHVKMNTRIREVAGTIQQSMLDHIYTKNCNLHKVSVVESVVSDHALLKAVINCSKPKVQVVFKKQTVVDWRNFNKDEGDHRCPDSRSHLNVHGEDQQGPHNHRDSRNE
jgi:hypothetical protein